MAPAPAAKSKLAAEGEGACPICGVNLTEEVVKVFACRLARLQGSFTGGLSYFVRSAPRLPDYTASCSIARARINFARRVSMSAPGSWFCTAPCATSTGALGSTAGK